VLLKIVYLLTCRVLGLAVLLFRGDLAKDAELLVLPARERGAAPPRQPGAVRAGRPGVVRRAGPGPPPQALDRCLPRDISALLAWQRKLAAKRYDTSQRRKPGRPPTVPGIARLVVRLATENPLWEDRRIHGELAKLGFAVAPSTVWEILDDAGIDPAPRGPDLAAVPGSSGRRDPRSRPSCTWTPRC
jgi:putative transposase